LFTVFEGATNWVAQKSQYSSNAFNLCQIRTKHLLQKFDGAVLGFAMTMNDECKDRNAFTAHTDH